MDSRSRYSARRGIWREPPQRSARREAAPKLNWHIHESRSQGFISWVRHSSSQGTVSAFATVYGWLGMGMGGESAALVEAGK